MKHILSSLINQLKNLITPSWWISIFKALKKGIPHFIKGSYMMMSFFVLLVTFLVSKIFHAFMKIPLIGVLFAIIHTFWMRGMNRLYDRLVVGIESARLTKLKRSYLISLAYKNLMVKKTRSFITILGMSVGVGIIVFLLSLGYGLERLIISKVAGLDELRIIDVSTGENTTLRLNAEVLNKLQKLPRVEKVIPFISLVGRVSFNKANTDTVVYAVPKDYLVINKIKLLKGSYFAQDTLFNPLTSGQVSGVEVEIKMATRGAKIREIDFNIKPDKLSMAWESCTVSSKLAGYVSRLEGGYEGVEYWGGEYAPFESFGRAAYDKIRNVYLGLWVKAYIPLFDKNSDGKYIPQLDDKGMHAWKEVCLPEKDLQVEPRLLFSEVLGESTESAVLEESVEEATDSASTYGSVVVIASGSGGLEVVSLQATDSAATAKKGSDVLKLDSPLSGETIVSLGFLRLLNIPEKQAIGQKFLVQFIVVKNLMPEVEGRVLTSQVEYTIKGVIDDVDTQYMYIPFADAQRIGIKNFSQVKVVFPDKDKMSTARKEIDSMGFKTNSTVDTVAQIETLFANLRILLGLLGMVALGVASLGMFNTLTVSLLERTREIGGMKTMGVVSDEIQDLFLAEAMIMGLGGGIGGLILGDLVGRALSFGISLIAIVNGQGYLTLTYVPPFLVFFIMLSSFMVGMITGFYPAQRAKRISALNALRYE